MALASVVEWQCARTAAEAFQLSGFSRWRWQTRELISRAHEALAGELAALSVLRSMHSHI